MSNHLSERWFIEIIYRPPLVIILTNWTSLISADRMNKEQIWCSDNYGNEEEYYEKTYASGFSRYGDDNVYVDRV